MFGQQRDRSAEALQGVINSTFKVLSKGVLQLLANEPVDEATKELLTDFANACGGEDVLVNPVTSDLTDMLGKAGVGGSTEPVTVDVESKDVTDKDK